MTIRNESAQQYPNKNKQKTFLAQVDQRIKASQIFSPSTAPYTLTPPLPYLDLNLHVDNLSNNNLYISQENKIEVY